MMTRALAKQISNDAIAALQAVAAKHNLSVVAKGGKFTDGTFAAKFEFAESDAARSMFNVFATMYGLQLDDFGATFRVNGRIFKIVGVNPSARAQPILAEDLQGKTYKFRAFDVVNALKAARG